MAIAIILTNTNIMIMCLKTSNVWCYPTKYILMINPEEKRIILQRKSGKALYNVTESLPGDWQV